jgi:hypothetical protein
MSPLISLPLTLLTAGGPSMQRTSKVTVALSPTPSL